jgi:hypothetical protein
MTSKFATTMRTRSNRVPPLPTPPKPRGARKTTTVWVGHDTAYRRKRENTWRYVLPCALDVGDTIYVTRRVEACIKYGDVEPDYSVVTLHVGTTDKNAYCWPAGEDRYWDSDAVMQGMVLQ